LKSKKGNSKKLKLKKEKFKNKKEECKSKKETICKSNIKEFNKLHKWHVFAKNSNSSYLPENKN